MGGGFDHPPVECGWSFRAKEWLPRENARFCAFPGGKEPHCSTSEPPRPGGGYRSGWGFVCRNRPPPRSASPATTHPDGRHRASLQVGAAQGARLPHRRRDRRHGGEGGVRGEEGDAPASPSSTSHTPQQVQSCRQWCPVLLCLAPLTVPGWTWPRERGRRL